MEDIASFVSSRGLLKSCVSRNDQPVSSSPHVDPHLLNRHRPGGTIYVCTDALTEFAYRHLDRLSQPFVLVSGDSDAPVDSALLGQEAIRRMLDSPLLMAWYAQNKVADHHKLQAMPIGMDYHTMWERPGLWGLTRQSAPAQERALMNVLAQAPEFSRRLYAGYCNWHFAIERGDRRECLEKIDKGISLIERGPLPRLSSWQRQAECMFVVSPEGAGMDCHRTWEALLLGCVPVLRNNKLAGLFERLPVVLLEDWGQFNSSEMIGHVARLREEKFNFSPLFLRYWAERLQGGARFELPDMTLAEFREFVCGGSY